MTEETLLPDSPQQINPEDYVGEGKKWKDLQTLIKSKNDSDSYVKIMEARLDDFREQITEMSKTNSTRASLEDLLKQADEQNLASKHTPPLKEDTTPTLKLEDIKNLAKQTYAEEETARQQQSNFNLVRAKLTEQLGDNYAETVRERIADLGMSEQEFNSLARSNPKLLINALGLEQTKKEPFQAPLRNSGNLKGKAPIKRTWSYYQDLKKNSPSLYRDPKIAVQMHDDAMSLGNEFYDGDFGDYTPVA